jgi:hypothetical protein
MKQANKPKDNAWIELYAKEVGEYFAKENKEDQSRKAVLAKELAKKQK